MLVDGRFIGNIDAAPEAIVRLTCGSSNCRGSNDRIEIVPTPMALMPVPVISPLSSERRASDRANRSASAAADRASNDCTAEGRLRILQWCRRG